VVPEAILSETSNKQAAAQIIDTMAKNALKVHREKKKEIAVRTHCDQALLNNLCEQLPKYMLTGDFFLLLAWQY
jgi:UDP-2,3-diacylglucosamine pyrophosphatase LpxH